MGFLWFAIISVMLTIYVVLDGFDIGIGALHLFLGRNDEERRTLLRSIGPVWDANEVWLLATGGVLYFVFPQLYASSFSGFYLPLMMVLWLLMLRAIGLEFRTHIDHGLWAHFFDGIFCIGSLLLAVFYGAALGNVVRGLPLGPDHYFFLPLWTNWGVGPHPGVLDWYTVLSGVIALVALCVHGANYAVVKTEGELNERARKTSLVLTPVLIVLTLLSLMATLSIHPNLLANYNKLPIGYAIPVLVAASLAGTFIFIRALSGHPSGRRPAVQPDGAELDYIGLCAEDRLALVDPGRRHRAGIFRLPLPHVPGQGVAGWRQRLRRLISTYNTATE